MSEGNDQPCYFCQVKCNSFAGNPGKWPVALTHADEPGVVKWHHVDCVTERLVTETALYLAGPEPVKLGGLSAKEARDLLSTMGMMGVREEDNDFARGWRSAVEFLEARLVHLGSNSNR